MKLNGNQENMDPNLNRKTMNPFTGPPTSQ